MNCLTYEISGLAASDLHESDCITGIGDMLTLAQMNHQLLLE